MSRSSPAKMMLAALSMLCACQSETTNEDDVYTLPLAQSAYLKASNPSVDAAFGHDIAFSGDTLVVGAYWGMSLTNGVDGVPIRSGAAYVFRRTATGWRPEAYLGASNPDEYDEFGGDVAISGDTIAVGAPSEDSTARGVDGDQNDDGVDTGAVYVFDRSGATWRQTAYVKASNTQAGDALGPASPPIFAGELFGAGVAISGDLLAVGAIGEDSAATDIDGDQNDTSAEGAGAVYVFRRAGSSWAQESYIKAPDARAYATFGMGLVISDDRLAVGATHAGDNENGAVYLFRRAGSSWVLEAMLQDSTLPSDSRYGYRLALSGDTLAVGAGGTNGTPASVYVYRRAGTEWQEEAVLQPTELGASTFFGISVALSGDTLAVGTSGDQDYGGSVYVYQRTGTEWQQEQRLRAPASALPDFFGSSVVLAKGALLVGSSNDDSAATGVGGDHTDTSAPGSGAVFVYE